MGYIDPGTGSSLVQTLIAIFTKIGDAWRSILGMFSSKKN